MIKFKQQLKNSPGQALVEFALIITVLLMLLFLIIESGRIFWAWTTVQQAAREGARYAITGRFEPTCNTIDIPKYADLCSDNDLRRPASVIGVTHVALSGLPLNENENSNFEDENYYNIEVFGADPDGQLKGSGLQPPYGPDPYAGAPENPVIVRVIYRVPIITPFFNFILPTIPVFGQTTLNNEQFGQLGGTGQSAGVPPPIPALPTPGPTPTDTPTPTPGSTSTFTPTPIPSETPTSPPCNIRFTSSLVANTGFASVTGLWDDAGSVNHTATFYDITAGDDPVVNPGGNIIALGTVTMVPSTGNTICPGIGDTFTSPLSPLLIAGNQIRVISTDGSTAVAIVQGGTDTPTPTATSTVTPTPAPTSTATATSSPTPLTAFIQTSPQCTSGSSVTLQVSGFNWPPNETINVYFNGSFRYQQPAPHSGSFSTSWVENGLSTNTYIISAQSASRSDTETLIVPCANVSPTPVTATPTFTPSPPDLVIVGPPLLLNPLPITEYQPVQFRVAITNTGQVAINQQFFVDLYFDPAEVNPDSIPLQYSSGYLAIGSLDANTGRVITITSATGFTGGFSNRQVYAMVDSLRIISETNELNNITGPTNVVVTPVSTPPITPTPNGASTIQGVVQSFIDSEWVPQYRALVWLEDLNNPGIVLGPATTNINGLYIFTNIPAGNSYSIMACLPTTDDDFVGNRPLITSPNLSANVFMLGDPGGCPLP